MSSARGGGRGLRFHVNRIPVMTTEYMTYLHIAAAIPITSLFHNLHLHLYQQTALTEPSPPPGKPTHERNTTIPITSFFHNFQDHPHQQTPLTAPPARQPHTLKQHNQKKGPKTSRNPKNPNDQNPTPKKWQERSRKPKKTKKTKALGHYGPWKGWASSSLSLQRNTCP